MQQFINMAPCIYFSSSDEGYILEVNDRLCRVLQYNREEIIGKKTDILLTVPSRIFQQTHFFPLLKMQQHVEEIYITLLRKNGEQLPVLLNAERTIVEGAAVNMYVGIIVHNRKKFEDDLIAAKKLAENALHENTALMQAKLEIQTHAEKLDEQFFIIQKQNEELRQINRVVTHEMQEPIRKLSLFSGMLPTDEAQKQTKFVDKIKKVAEQMRSILSGLQQYVWLNETPVHMQTLQLSALLEPLIVRLQTEHPGVLLVLQKEGIDTMEADAQQVSLLLYELLSNAIHFRKTDQPAKVHILVDKIRLNQFRHVEDKYKFVEYIRIQVRDEGKGLAPAYTTQVFELFRRLHMESGKGIGLSLCKKIVDNHHGMIYMDSETDKGCLVTVQFPGGPADAIQSATTALNIEVHDT